MWKGPGQKSNMVRIILSPSTPLSLTITLSETFTSVLCAQYYIHVCQAGFSTYADI